MTKQHFAVLTADKQTGSGGGLSAHIDREKWDAEQSKLVPFVPQSVIHPQRSHLNKDYILQPGEGRTAAIERRICEAGITRKIRDDQVKAITFICSSDHEKMQELWKTNKIDEWAKDCIAYLQKKFGQENVVAAALHMDEYSPHLHVTVVPIVQGQAKQRKPRPKLDDNGHPIEKPKKRKYKKQVTNARLAAYDLMTPTTMTMWQTEFGALMGKYGMVRGIEGSNAKHMEPAKYNAIEQARESVLGIFGQDEKSKKMRDQIEAAQREKEEGIKKAKEEAREEVKQDILELEEKLHRASEEMKQFPQKIEDAKIEGQNQTIQDICQAAGITSEGITVNAIGKGLRNFHQTSIDVAAQRDRLLSLPILQRILDIIRAVARNIKEAFTGEDRQLIRVAIKGNSHEEEKRNAEKLWDFAKEQGIDSYPAWIEDARKAFMAIADDRWPEQQEERVGRWQRCP